MKYYLLLFALLMGCNQFRTPTCPCVITSVRSDTEDGEIYYCYTLVDSTGVSAIRFHSKTLYSIGDTIGAKPDLHRDWMRELSEKQNNTIGK